MKVPTDRQMLARLKEAGLTPADLPSYKRGVQQVIDRKRQQKGKTQ